MLALAAGLLLGLSVMPACSLLCPTPEQEAYFDEAGDWGERTADASRDLQDILFELDSRTGTLLDDGWRRRLKRTLDESTSGHQEIMNVEVPAGAEDMHRAVVRVAELAIETNELLWQGVRDENVEALLRAHGRYLEVNRRIDELLRVAESFCE